MSAIQAAPDVCGGARGGVVPAEYGSASGVRIVAAAAAGMTAAVEALTETGLLLHRI